MRLKLNCLWLASLAAALCVSAWPHAHPRAQTAASPLAQDGADVDTTRPGVISLKLGRGGRVAVDNRTTGRIRVVGWDRDEVEATAVSERGAERVRVEFISGSEGSKVYLKADYAAPSVFGPQLGPPEPASAPAEPPPAVSPRAAGGSRGNLPALPGAAGSTRPVLAGRLPRDLGPIVLFDQRPREVHLEVKLPRYAELEVIRVVRSEVEVTGLDTPVTVSGDRSAIKLSQIGQAEVRTRGGPVEVDGAKGPVSVITVSGPITVRRAEGDVRTFSVSGHVNIQCARGRVNVSTTDGRVTLASISGDVEADTASGQINLTGAVRPDGSYRLRSMWGAVEVSLPGNTQGFTASLSSYRGTVETQFPLKSKGAAASNHASQRLIGTFGSGRAQIALDSFEGSVRLGKTTQRLSADCR